MTTMKISEKVVIFIILSFFGKITECKNSKAMERLERDVDVDEGRAGASIRTLGDVT